MRNLPNPDFSRMSGASSRLSIFSLNMEVTNFSITQYSLDCEIPQERPDIKEKLNGQQTSRH